MIVNNLNEINKNLSDIADKLESATQLSPELAKQLQEVFANLQIELKKLYQHTTH